MIALDDTEALIVFTMCMVVSSVPTEHVGIPEHLGLLARTGYLARIGQEALGKEIDEEDARVVAELLVWSNTKMGGIDQFGSIVGDVASGEENEEILTRSLTDAWGSLSGKVLHLAHVNVPHVNWDDVTGES